MVNGEIECLRACGLLLAGGMILSRVAAAVAEPPGASQPAATVVASAVPEGAPVSPHWTVNVNGSAAGVYADQRHGFVAFSFGGGPVKVEIACRFAVNGVAVLPASCGVVPAVAGNIVSFALDRPRKLSVEFGGDRFLFLFADSLETDVPDRRDPGVIWYEPGCHDLKRQDLPLASGQTLYLSAGAYLANGRHLTIQDARNVKVRGRGVLVAATRVMNSRDVDIRDIVINPNLRGWMNTIAASRHVRYANTKSLAGDDSVFNFDGFDVMSGCRHVTVEDVFVKATDDVLSVKHHPTGPHHWRGKAPISHVTMRDSVVWNLKGVSLVRIGPETIGTSIENVAMRNVDVVHNRLNLFEIWANDGARVRNLLCEDIRVLNLAGSFVNFRMSDWYKVGPRRGIVDGVYIRNVELRGGAPPKIAIEGADPEHTFRNVNLCGIRHDGKPVEPAVPPAARPAAAARPPAPGQDPCAGVEPPRDTAPPAPVSATALTAGPAGACVYVTFSEQLDEASAEDPGNYGVSDGVRVLQARLDYHYRQAILSTSGMSPGGRYTLTVRGVTDLSGNAIETAELPVDVRSAATASEGYGVFQGADGWWYEQFHPKPVQVYANRRDIVSQPRYMLMDYYPAPDDRQWLGHRQDTRIERNAMRPGREYRAVRTWMAPADGRVRITGRVSAKPGKEGQAGNGPKVRIVHNPAGTHLAEDDIVLWDWQTVGPTPLAHDAACNVRAGGVVRFVADIDASPSAAAIEWDPSVAY